MTQPISRRQAQRLQAQSAANEPVQAERPRRTLFDILFGGRESTQVERVSGTTRGRRAPSTADALRQPRSQTRQVRASAPARAAAAPAPQQAASEQPNFFERLFGIGRARRGSVSSSAAQQELMRQTGGRLRPNHAYVVQLDRKNDGSNNGALKGQTFVFSTDAQCRLTLANTFNSSSQPMRANPYGADGTSAFATADGNYSYPYILDGMYSMSTQAITHGTRGLPIEAYRAYRDTNRNGRIDADEMRQVRSTSLIRFHTAALGSAGCQTIDDRQWASFVRTVGAAGRSGATYVLRRT